MDINKSLSKEDIVYFDEDGIERKEFWFPLPEAEGMYEISSIGRKRTLHRIFIRKNGYKMTIKEKILKQCYNNGYSVDCLVNKKGDIVPLKIHRVVATELIPNPLNLPEVNHKNNIRHDNRVENLEWCTRKHNNNHSYLFGNKKPPSGTSNGRSKLTEFQVLAIRRLHSLNPNFNRNKVKEKYNISIPVISKIILRISWKHL